MLGIKAVGKYRLLVFRALCGCGWKVTVHQFNAAWFGVSIREYRTVDCLRAPHLRIIATIFDLSLVFRFAWLAISRVAIQLIAIRQIAAVRLFQAQKEVSVILRMKL
jgi:hypothetical protein